MKIISHRGNRQGSHERLENHPTYIKSVVRDGYDCEIDVWYLDGSFKLGHDEPCYNVDESFLESSKLWCHAKNLAALEKMMNNSKIHSFWHEEDKFTITSKGFIWTFPDNLTTKKSVIVYKGQFWKDEKFGPEQPFGICTDFLN